MFRSKMLLLLSVVLVTTSLLAHETPAMEGARLALYTWTHAMANADIEELKGVLDQEMTFNGRTQRDAYLQSFGPTMAQVSDAKIVLKYAHYEPVEGGIRVQPVIWTRGRGAFSTAFSLTLRQTAQGWTVWRISTARNGVLPTELTAPDLPERYKLYPVAVRLRDADTGEPVCARVHVEDSRKRYWPPQGHEKNVVTGWREDVGRDLVFGERTYAYVDPDFILPLPEGRYSVETVRGIEYEPAVQDFEVSQNGCSTLDIKLKRWSHAEKDGWYSGDTHVHFLDPHTAMLEARGEDLNVVNVLATKLRELITSVGHFTGVPDRVSDSRNIVYVSEESRHGFLGHTILLNLKRLVYPLSWGGPQEGVPGGIDYPPMARIADEAHAQGGLVSWAHFPYPKGELAVDVALGKLDSIDLMTARDSFASRDNLLVPADVWYGFLNCGFRLPAAAGTDKMWNTQVIGTPRTYVKLKGAFTYQAWVDGIRAGRNFVTTGPMLFFTAGKGIQPGDTIRAKKGDLIDVRVRISSRIPVERVEIIRGGKIVAVKENAEKSRELVFEAKVPVEGSSWIAARASAAHIIPNSARGIPIMAHASPVYLDVEGSRCSSPKDAALFVTWIDEALNWVQSKANIPDSGQKAEMMKLFQKAKAVYLQQKP
ncbi:MAG: CehA/McbA family metallohydrolase [Acidobacteriota bacterium]